MLYSIQHQIYEMFDKIATEYLHPSTLTPNMVKSACSFRNEWFSRSSNKYKRGKGAVIWNSECSLSFEECRVISGMKKAKFMNAVKFVGPFDIVLMKSEEISVKIKASGLNLNEASVKLSH